MRIEERNINGFKAKVFHLDGYVIGIPTEIGPRILYFASKNKPEFNLFGILPDVGVETPEGFWRVYGGHRLWSSPEAMPRSYSLDDKPVRIEVDDENVTIHGNPEVANSIQKTITVTAGSDGIQVTHRIRNIGRWPITLACWALTIVRPEGFAIIPVHPLKVDERGLLPDRHITLWPYTDLSDRRLIFSGDYIFVKMDSSVKSPVKVGAMARPSWTAYWVDGFLFIKRFDSLEGEYPDFGCNVEVYTNAGMLELETLSPLRLLEPNCIAEHRETWSIMEIGELSPKSEEMGRVESAIG